MNQHAIIDKNDAKWLERALIDLREQGFAVIGGVLDRAFLSEARPAFYDAQKKIRSEISADRLERAKELGVLRLPMKYNELFYRFLALPEILKVVDATIGETAILHLQNAFILPSAPRGEQARVFQNQFHRDFPRHMNGYLASINAYLSIDEFTSTNGATLVVPGTHQQAQGPDTPTMERNAVPLLCPAGTLIMFDSTLWHAAGQNYSGADRLSINHQFTRSFIKQQIDYVRALGESAVLGQKPRTQQLLGYYTRVVTSLDEYYQPEEKRLYRKGQG